nr:uncharacterized protein LOC111509374 [Leptinotarsa decemlineata]
MTSSLKNLGSSEDYGIYHKRVDTKNSFSVLQTPDNSDKDSPVDSEKIEVSEIDENTTNTSKQNLRKKRKCRKRRKRKNKLKKKIDNVFYSTETKQDAINDERTSVVPIETTSQSERRANEQGLNVDDCKFDNTVNPISQNEIDFENEIDQLQLEEQNENLNFFPWSENNCESPEVPFAGEVEDYNNVTSENTKNVYYERIIDDVESAENSQEMSEVNDISNLISSQRRQVDVEEIENIYRLWKNINPSLNDLFKCLCVGLVTCLFLYGAYKMLS